MGYTFIPYIIKDGIPTFKDSDITKMYHQTIVDGSHKSLFHDGSIKNAQEFLWYIKSGLCIFYAVFEGDDKRPIGMFWLNRIEQTHCYIHFTFFKRFWGKDTVTVGREALQIALSEFDMIMAMTPVDNLLALNYIRKVGVTFVGEVPHLMWSEEKQESVMGILSYITKEGLDESIHKTDR